MTGLLTKDYRLFMNQKRFFISLLLVAVFLMFMQNDASFIMGYITIICSTFVMSTISYDDYDNGNSFLFTLPITRREYAVEKYVFGLLLVLSAWILSFIVGTIYNYTVLPDFDFFEHCFESSVMIYLALLVVSVMIPVCLKFGSEKARLAIAGIFAGVFAVAIVVIRFMSDLGIKVGDILPDISDISPWMASVLIAVITLFVYFVSMAISIRVMEKKEF